MLYCIFTNDSIYFLLLHRRSNDENWPPETSVVPQIPPNRRVVLPPPAGHLPVPHSRHHTAPTMQSTHYCVGPSVLDSSFRPPHQQSIHKTLESSFPCKCPRANGKSHLRDFTTAKRAFADFTTDPQTVSRKVCGGGISRERSFGSSFVDVTTRKK